MATVSTAEIIRTADQNAGGNVELSLNALPNECPLCHVTIEPEFLPGARLVFAFDWVEAYYRCTNMKCRRHFTALYRVVGQNGPRRSCRLERCDPAAPQPPAFDPVIETVSPAFMRVYAQSTSAEAHGLAEIAGPGFRKALEFLIKDYAIQLNPGHDDEIKRGQLAAVISKFLPGDKLTIVSSRAAWLGNDETHYERRWVDKDLQDLKKLISATVHFIAMERLAADLPTEMPPTGPVAAPTS